MPYKTIYVSDDDLPLYGRAQELAGGNLSAAIARALRRYVQIEEGRLEGFEPITVRVGTGRAQRSVRFQGVLLGEWRHPTAKYRIEIFRVYRTRRGRFVLHIRRMPNWAIWADPQAWTQDWEQFREWKERGWWGPAESTLKVVEKLEDLKDLLPPEFYESLEEAANHPIIEELDI